MIVLCGFLGVLCVRANADSPSTQPKPREDSVAKAVKVLTKEARDSIRLKQPFPRTESDYFKKSPGNVDVVKLFEALIRPIANPRIDSYVKWQLLSVLPEKLDAKFERAGTKVLLAAPALAPLPGATFTTRDAMNKRIESLKQSDMDAFNQTHRDELKSLIDRSAIVIRYRNELSARLPIAEQCLKARLDELWMRGSYGFDIDAESRVLFDDMRTWKSHADPKQVEQMAITIDDYASRPQPFILDHVEWKPDESRAVWISKNTSFDSKSLHELAIELNPSLANQKN